MNIKKILLILLILSLSNCSFWKKDEEAKKEESQQATTAKKKRIEPNIWKKTMEREEGLIFGKKNSGNTNYEFSTSNPLWRATLNTIDFMPLVNVSYSGGSIITDWYSSNNTKESIKISVRFLSNEVKASSIKITAHKKICAEKDNCTISKMNDSFTNSIKSQILEEVRKIKIAEAQKKK